MRGFNKLQLPKDFAQRLLDNQIQFKLSEEPPSQIVCNLLQLYSQGVEYYESVKSYKYLYFKKKMEELFNSDKPLFTEKKEESPQQNQSPIRKKMKSGNQIQRIEALKIKEKQQKMENQVSELTKHTNTKKEVDKIIRNVHQKQKVVQNKIKSVLEDQNQQLQLKLQQRKKRSFCKSFSAFGLTQGTQTKESLFTDDCLMKPANQKCAIQPLIVNFQNLIHEDDSDHQDKQIVLKKPSMITRGKMASMGKFN